MKKNFCLKRWAVLGMLAGFMVLAHMAPAAAQVNLFRSYKGPFLTQGDYAVGNQAAVQLLQSDKGVGGTQNWNNPDTGNGGILTILGESVSSENLPCRELQSYVYYKDKSARTVTYTLNVCKQSDGKWKIAD